MTVEENKMDAVPASRCLIDLWNRVVRSVAELKFDEQAHTYHQTKVSLNVPKTHSSSVYIYGRETFHS